jgi:hypothetical protein
MRQTFSFDSIGVPTTNPSFAGPCNLGFTHLLTRARATIQFSVTGVVIGTASTFGAAPVWGVQYGHVGYTPLDIQTDADSDRWLWIEKIDTGSTPAFWAPNTDSASFLANASQIREWNAQLPVNDDIDLYATFGNFGGGAVSLQIATYLEFIVA